MLIHKPGYHSTWGEFLAQSNNGLNRIDFMERSKARKMKKILRIKNLKKKIRTYAVGILRIKK